MGEGNSVRLIRPTIAAFSVAAATLLLQLVQTRIFSVVYWNHIVYFIISVALLGFGISGTWMSFGEDSRLARTLTVPLAGFLFFVSTLVSSLVMTQLDVNSAALATSKSSQWLLYLTYSVAVLPYFFSGWILGLVFRDYAEHMNFLYFADLVGAAAGCILFIVLIRPLGAVTLVIVAAGLVTFPALALYPRSRVSLYGGILCVATAIGIISFEFEIDRSIRPERTKAIVAMYHLTGGERSVSPSLEFSEWNPISRIDVTGSVRHRGEYRGFIDGDAWTAMVLDRKEPRKPWKLEEQCLMTWASPYLLKWAPESVLVIGSGGGVDVLNAICAKAKQIDAIEINPTTARIVVDEFADFTKQVFGQPTVSVHCEEGRSFVRRGGKHYDVIIMNAIDTFAALNSGAYVLSESYLYTVEAMKDYLTHLTPGGILNISRWKTPAESVRLFAVMLEALYELGYENPESHLIAAYNPRNEFIGFMASNQPFTTEHVDTIRGHVSQHGLEMVFPIRAEDESYAVQRTIAKYADLRREGKQLDTLAEFNYDARPVWDDSPFFFNFLSVRQLFMARYTSSASQILRGGRASLTLFTLLGLLTVVVVLFMVLPLLKRGRARIPRFKSWLAYFLCLGISFIFVEIALMQRFSLLLGHPARSLALVLATLLLFAGIGSQARAMLRLPLAVGLAGGIVSILVAAFVYPYIVPLVLGWELWQRGLVTAVLVAPLGFFMGMPFPEGIRLVATHARDAVPWMWGVNGGATVLGSV
ncbi:MAG TPA: hypothetical protein PK869_08775, partial [Candidatus Hydrogenedentes bacterium]|nr:hypothetical protein [Candidatus Hydrogenedentota bacterium]